MIKILMSIIILSSTLLMGCMSRTFDAPQCFDAAIMQIEFFDAQSLQTTLSKKINTQKEQGKQVVHYYNHDGGEMLTLMLDPNLAEPLVRHVWVGRVDKKGLIRLPWLKHVQQFVTAKNIKVGMTREEVEAQLGEPHEVKQNKSGIFEMGYLITDKKSPLLKKYKQKQYSASYIFVGHKLKWFNFGFDINDKRVE